MCRKKCLQGCCCICFGLGLMVGFTLESWLFCCLIGLGLLFFGLVLTKQR